MSQILTLRNESLTFVKQKWQNEYEDPIGTIDS